MSMFEYEKIEPVFPGNHIEGWQKTRKKQWNYVKKTLRYPLNMKSDYIAHTKKWAYLLDKPPFVEDSEFSWPGPDIHPGHWIPSPFLGFFICSDQSDEAWKKIWHFFSRDGGGSFDSRRKTILDAIPHGQGPDENNQESFGTFGGLEQRMLPYLVQSDVYTDETFQLGRDECRKIPWKSAFLTFRHIFSQITTAVDSDYWVSPYFYAQWLHGLFVSCFEYDLDKHPDINIDNMYLYCRRLKNTLSNNADDTFHSNHLKAARLLITILEDEGTPQWLRKIWVDVRDGKVSG
jgi:hypothetical protein